MSALVGILIRLRIDLQPFQRGTIVIVMMIMVVMVMVMVMVVIMVVVVIMPLHLRQPALFPLPCAPEHPHRGAQNNDRRDHL
ncbi:hypothetical protein D3C76_1288870 [compost metagenome]